MSTLLAQTEQPVDTTKMNIYATKLLRQKTFAVLLIFSNRESFLSKNLFPHGKLVEY